MIITILSTHFLFQLYRILMLVGRKNCRKIVQFLVEPLIKKQSISPRVSGFLCPIQLERIKTKRF